MPPDLLSAIRDLQRRAKLLGPCHQLFVTLYLAGVKLLFQSGAATKKCYAPFVTANDRFAATGKGNDQGQIQLPPTSQPQQSGSSGSQLPVQSGSAAWTQSEAPLRPVQE